MKVSNKFQFTRKNKHILSFKNVHFIKFSFSLIFYFSEVFAIKFGIFLHMNRYSHWFFHIDFENFILSVKFGTPCKFLYMVKFKVKCGIVFFYLPHS